MLIDISKRKRKLQDVLQTPSTGISHLQTGKRGDQDEAGDEQGQAAAISLLHYLNTKETFPPVFQGAMGGGVIQTFSNKDNRKKLLKRDKLNTHLTEINCISLSNRLTD